MIQDYHSKFHEWIRNVKKTQRTINYLEQRRQFYNHRWMSIAGPSFDRTGGHTNDPYYVKGMDDLSHMLEIDKKLDKLELVIKEYNEFFDSLPRKFQLILTSITLGKPTMVEVSHMLHVSRNMVYKLKESLIKIWLEKEEEKTAKQ